MSPISRRFRRLRATLAAFCVAALCACNPSVPAGDEASDDPPAAIRPEATASEPPPDAGVAPKDAEAAGDAEAVAAPGSKGAWRHDVVDVPSAAESIAIVVAGRAARHPGFDRLVVELEGQGTPGYHVEHIDRPVRACGSGDVVPLPGDSWLALRIDPAQAHDEGGRVTARPPPIAGLGVVLAIAQTCDFEAQVEWVLALRAPNRYRIDVLQKPLRLVLDVAH